MAENAEKTHCKYFVLRKKRYCKMLIKKGEEFCGEHQRTTNEAMQQLEENTRMRIICPLDKKHTCYAHNLKKHLKVCNARQTNVEPFIVKGINTGSIEEDSRDESYKMLSSFSVSEILNVVDKIKNVYEKYCKGNIAENNSTNSLIEDELKNPEYGDNTKKHLKQLSALLGLLGQYEMIQNNTCFIEFGAGRGQLSYWIARETQKNEDVRVLLVEKASPKHKRDNKLAKTTDRVRRIRADISDLFLDKVEVIESTQRLVGITKHLCGEATDLALRCMANVEKNKDKLKGIFFTFCCHHRCRWSPYTGKEFFKANQLSQNDFDVMCGIASWATCGSGYSREKRSLISEDDCSNDNSDSKRDNQLSLTRKEKEEIGRKCKNVINWGRLAYLENLGFKCILNHYVSKDVTLENVCLIAHKN